MTRIGLTAITAAIAVILLTANTTIINAQQQEQATSQTSAIEDGTAAGATTFQSTTDSFRVQVPEGWVIQDLNNTGSVLLEETRQGYGILAQLCTEDQQQQQQPGVATASTNASGSISDNTLSCDPSENDVIHIVRYPDLDTRLLANNVTFDDNMTTDNILSYHLQKLQEVGYRSIQLVNSSDTTINVANPQTNETIATVPAKTVEMTYSTNFAPNETRTGSFILTSTNATAPNPGTTKGYSVFYEGNSTATTTAETTRPSVSLASTPLPAPVRQVFDSFELVAAPAPLPPPPPPPPPPPEAATTVPLTVEITSSDTEGEVAPATFEFDADVTGGTEPYTYSWDFDGEGSEEIDDDETEHTFEEAGSYNVGLTVTDSEGRIGSDNMEITVEEAPEEEEEDNNNSGSDGLLGVDDLIGDLF